MSPERTAQTLPAVPLPGLAPDSLGSYLASLGLLRLLARRWPAVRGCWRDGELVVVGGPGSFEALAEYLTGIGRESAWTPYEQPWSGPQKEDTKKQAGTKTAAWRATASETEVALATAHLVAAARLHFNPLLGSGGNAGRRNFAAGWAKAVEAIRRPSRSFPAEGVAEDLRRFLRGGACRYLKDWGAASWFTCANKAYNSGQAAYRDGQLTPWAMVLACEGLHFFAGAPSRRLGARSRAQAAFPFLTAGAAPATAGLAGLARAEVWAPIWRRPMSVPEVSLLFSRGRAEIQGRGATTPAAFAAAILSRGVDAGIDGFRRFVLAQTTSANTFESRLQVTIPVRERAILSAVEREAAEPDSEVWEAIGEAVEVLLTLFESLPRDHQVGQRWHFAGLRGPLERAIVSLAARPRDPSRARGALDAAADALAKVDRNLAHRKAGVGFALLPGRWAPALFADEPATLEARLALGLASVGAATEAGPLLQQILGVELGRSRVWFPERVPHRRVWSTGPVIDSLGASLRRRLVDARPDHPLPFGATLSLALEDVGALLRGEVDEASLERWLRRLVLFDWRRPNASVRRLVRPPAPAASAPDGALALYALLRPLLDPRPFRDGDGRPFFREEGGEPRTLQAGRRLAALLEAGQVDAAVQLAASRYHVARRPVGEHRATFRCSNPKRLLAGLLLPPVAGPLLHLTERWLRPVRDR